MARTAEQERRASPRIEINGELSYSTADSGQIQRGMIEDMSLGGARIWLSEELPAASRVTIRVESEEENPLEFVATLLHRLPRRKESLYGYGCALEMTDGSLN